MRLCTCDNQMVPHDPMRSCPPDEPPCVPQCCHACEVCWHLGCRYDEWKAEREREAPT